jgi:tetratricopeptide (TPR) repeat protein
MADVFISYASEDRDRVRPLAEALQSRGFNVWWDRELAAGQDYAAQIERELKTAKAVIVVWTKSSTLSSFVRDEAGRARDEGRLVPVMLDKVEIPLGFGAFQAEDFTRWNGGASAPQVGLLEEVLKAKLSGRDVDGAEIARRRRRLGTRIRIVSVLTVIALIIGIFVGGKYLIAPPQPDLRAQLLQLLAEGRLTPEQAIQLAEILEAGSLGTQQASFQVPANSGASSVPADSTTSTRTQTAPTGISEAEFTASARDAYRAAFLAVAQHPDAQVRLAAAQMAAPATRDAAMNTLWAYAQAHPDDPLRDEIYLLCGSIGEANNLPLGQQALEAATSLSPRNRDAWRLLSRSYGRANRGAEAQATAQVSNAIDAVNQGNTAAAEQQLQEALPTLTAPELRAPVASELGQIAEQRGDFSAASARYSQAYASREQLARAEPYSPAAQVLDADAQRLVVALDRSGRTQEACERLRQAQDAHDVAAPDQELLNRCQRLRVPLRDRVRLSPQLRDQRATTPAPASAP